MAASPQKRPWVFDVSSLMVLVGEDEELRYRLSYRNALQCIAMAPAVGLQSYLRSYDMLLEPGSLKYFSPSGCKSAPLRNTRLKNTIRIEKLLEDKRYTVFYITDSGAARRNQILVASWTIVTWLIFAGLLVYAILVPNATWIGVANCAVLTGWSILLRLVEHLNIKPAPVDRRNITCPDDDDAVFILGRNNSALVLKGTRQQVKEWTSLGPVYKDRTLGIPSQVWQGFTRLGSLLVLLFVFSTIPNGSTIDQVAFIILNGLAQLNVLIGQGLDSKCCLSQLKKDTDTRVETRTHIYANLLRHFKDIKQKTKWVKESGMLPQTEAWKEWTEQVVLQEDRDPKELYNEIVGKASR